MTLSLTLAISDRSPKCQNMSAVTSTSLPHASSSVDVLGAVGRAKPASHLRRWLIRASWILGILIALLAAVPLVLPPPGARSPRQFVTEPARLRDLSVTATATGALEGLNTVTVGSEVSGLIVQLKADFNDLVTEGQVLAVIAPEQSSAAVNEAKASVASAEASAEEQKANYEEARLNWTRGEKEVSLGLISQKEFAGLVAAEKRGKAALVRSQAAVQLARAGLHSALSRLEKTVIRAPRSGVVQARLVEPGQTVAAGMQTPALFKITDDLRKMRLLIQIDEADIGRVAEGQEATFTVDAHPDKVFQSRVLSIRNDPHEKQNVVTYEAVLAVDNEGRLLRPGMTATATIVTQRRTRVLTVPSAAFRFALPKEAKWGLGPPGSTVAPAASGGIWILAGSEPRHVAVTAGDGDGEFTEVLPIGLVAEGDQIITDLGSERP